MDDIRIPTDVFPLLSISVDLLCQNAENLLHRVRLHTKNRIELAGWKTELGNYVKWYDGKTALHGVPPPAEDNKVHISDSKAKNACITWNQIFQQRKYLSDLKLPENAFAGKVILDLCAGPHPNALCFKDCEVFGIDHLMKEYERAGFPTKEYDKRYHFVDGKIEKMPFEGKCFDAVIAVNALDHIDSLDAAAREIKRVIKDDGMLRFIVEYHKPTMAEPLQLNDEHILDRFSWAKNLHKVSESAYDWGWNNTGNEKSGSSQKNHDGDPRMRSKWYVVWSTF